MSYTARERRLRWDDSEKIPENFDYLKSELDYEDLLPTLMSKNAISMQDADWIRSQHTRRAGNHCLLDIIQGHGQWAFDHFVNTLCAKGYGRAVDVLVGNPYSERYGQSSGHESFRSYGGHSPRPGNYRQEPVYESPWSTRMEREVHHLRELERKLQELEDRRRFISDDLGGQMREIDHLKMQIENQNALITSINSSRHAYDERPLRDMYDVNSGLNMDTSFRRFTKFNIGLNAFTF